MPSQTTTTQLQPTPDYTAALTSYENMNSLLTTVYGLEATPKTVLVDNPAYADKLRKRREDLRNAEKQLASFDATPDLTQKEIEDNRPKLVKAIDDINKDIQTMQVEKTTYDYSWTPEMEAKIKTAGEIDTKINDIAGQVVTALKTVTDDKFVEKLSADIDALYTGTEDKEGLIQLNDSIISNFNKTINDTVSGLSATAATGDLDNAIDYLKQVKTLAEDYGTTVTTTIDSAASIAKEGKQNIMDIIDSYSQKVGTTGEEYGKLVTQYWDKARAMNKVTLGKIGEQMKADLARTAAALGRAPSDPRFAQQMVQELADKTAEFELVTSSQEIKQLSENLKDTGLRQAQAELLKADVEGKATDMLTNLEMERLRQKQVANAQQQQALYGMADVEQRRAAMEENARLAAQAQKVGLRQFQAASAADLAGEGLRLRERAGQQKIGLKTAIPSLVAGLGAQAQGTLGTAQAGQRGRLLEGIQGMGGFLQGQMAAAQPFTPQTSTMRQPITWLDVLNTGAQVGLGALGLGAILRKG